MIEGRISNMLPTEELLKKGFSLEEILMAASGDDNITVLEEIMLWITDLKGEKTE